MKNDIEKINLAWAIIWAFVLVSAIAGIFWNPAQFFSAVVAAIFFSMYLRDYIRARKNNK